MAPERKEPAIVSDLPDHYDPQLAGDEYRPQKWWAAFNDPVLDQLVDRALANNLDIIEAAGRLEQASAHARIARSALLPNVNVSAGSSFSDTPLSGSAFGDLGGGQFTRLESESYSLSLGASYELDLFGRVRGDAAAARQDALAASYDLHTVKLASAAETIAAYFDLVDTRRQIELTRLRLDVLEDRVARSEERFERGLIESFQLYQLRQDLRVVQSSLPQLESGLVANRSRLALLLGDYPQSLDNVMAGELRPRLVFDDVPAGLPLDLLAQRPDIAAAHARLEASRQRIGARRAERFPQISLSGSYGSQGGDPGAVFDIGSNWTASLASSIVAPIFDAGRISANIRAARAQYDQNAAAYARSVLSAYGEVQSALADYREQRERYRIVTEQLVVAQASFDLQKRRFAAGVGDYTTYLDALRTLYQVEGSLSSAARATALARLGVHRALGGDWVGEGADEVPVAGLEMRAGDSSTLGDKP